MLFSNIIESRENFGFVNILTLDEVLRYLLGIRSMFYDILYLFIGINSILREESVLFDIIS